MDSGRVYLGFVKWAKCQVIRVLAPFLGKVGPGTLRADQVRTVGNIIPGLGNPLGP